MRISEEQVRYVAVLANLHLSPEEISRFQHELDGILEHMEQLNRIDTTGVEPMAQVLFESQLFETEESDSLRADQIVPPLGNAAALANAPQPGAGYFKVAKVIER